METVRSQHYLKNIILNDEVPCFLRPTALLLLLSETDGYFLASGGRFSNLRGGEVNSRHLKLSGVQV